MRVSASSESGSTWSSSNGYPTHHCETRLSHTRRVGALCARGSRDERQARAGRIHPGPGSFHTRSGGAARKVDQYAAQKVIHSEGGSFYVLLI